MATKTFSFLAFVTLAVVRFETAAQVVDRADTVVVKSGPLTLTAFLWRPQGRGPFPAVLFNHGSYGSTDFDPKEAETLGPVFARHGYVFLYLCRQGVGPSRGQGTPAGDVMARAAGEGGQEARNRVQLQLLQNEELNEGLAGLSFLRGLPEVESRRIMVAGHSFGGSLSLFIAERETRVRAAVVFAAAAGSWDQSSELRSRLLAAVRRTRAPVLFVHAANDYSIAPGPALAAEMQRLGKPHGLKIYPAFGRDDRDGHNFHYRNAVAWESEVFAFLAQHQR